MRTSLCIVGTSGFFHTDDANNEEFCVGMLEGVDEALETMRIEEEPAGFDDEIQLVETIAAFESATGFKGFEALQSIVLNQLRCSNVQTEARQHMYDEPRQSFGTF